MLAYDKRHRAITCKFCHDAHLTLIFFWSLKNVCLKESEVWHKVISNKILSPCHTKFAVFFSLLSCCIGSLISKSDKPFQTTYEQQLLH